MSIPSSKPSSFSDVTQYRRALRSSHSVYAIAHQYRDRLISAEFAKKLLENSNYKGSKLAGEIALKQAYLSTDQSTVLAELSYAHKMFEKSIWLGKIASKDSTNASIAQSQVHIAQLPIHGLLILEGKLPPSRLAEKVILKTAEIGHALAQTINPSDYIYDKNEAKDTIGTISKLAILLLLDDTALDIGSDSWFPLLSHFSENYRNTRGNVSNYDQDIVIFTDSNPDILTPEYKLKVKSTKTTSTEALDVAGITSIYVNPDIKILTDKYLLGVTAIEEIYQSLNSINKDQVVEANIIRRKQQLLNRLDSA